MKYFKVFEMAKINMSVEEIIDFYISLNKKIIKKFKDKFGLEYKKLKYDGSSRDLPMSNGILDNLKFDREYLIDAFTEVSDEYFGMYYYFQEPPLRFKYSFIYFVIKKDYEFIIINDNDKNESFHMKNLSNIETYVMDYLDDKIKEYFEENVY